MSQYNCLNFDLNPLQPLGKQLHRVYVKTFHGALAYIHGLAYQAVSDIDSLYLVFDEKRGTCSTKHAYLAQLAHENNCASVNVELGFFKAIPTMFHEILSKMQLLKMPYILEAHCYLKYQENIIDVTSKTFNLEALFDIQEPMETQMLSPAQCGNYKQELHHKKFEMWSLHHNLPFDQCWQLRTDLIKKLVQEDF